MANLSLTEKYLVSIETFIIEHKRAQRTYNYLKDVQLKRAVEESEEATTQLNEQIEAFNCKKQQLQKIHDDFSLKEQKDETENKIESLNPENIKDNILHERIQKLLENRKQRDEAMRKRFEKMINNNLNQYIQSENNFKSDLVEKQNQIKTLFLKTYYENLHKFYFFSFLN